jgi:hypothetical protein
MARFGQNRASRWGQWAIHAIMGLPIGHHEDKANMGTVPEYPLDKLVSIHLGQLDLRKHGVEWFSYAEHDCFQRICSRSNVKST